MLMKAELARFTIQKDRPESANFLPITVVTSNLHLCPIRIICPSKQGILKTLVPNICFKKVCQKNKSIYIRAFHTSYMMLKCEVNAMFVRNK